MDAMFIVAHASISDAAQSSPPSVAPALCLGRLRVQGSCGARKGNVICPARSCASTILQTFNDAVLLFFLHTPSAAAISSAPYLSPLCTHTLSALSPLSCVMDYRFSR